MAPFHPPFGEGNLNNRKVKGKMPHTNKNGAKTPGQLSPGFKPSNFININLTGEQIAENKAWRLSIEEMDNLMHALCFDGFKFTMRFDKFNDCFACWLVPPDGHRWSGRILAGRGSTPTKALKQLLYVHYKALETDWDTVQDQVALVLDD